MRVEAFRYSMFASVNHRIPSWALVFKGVDHATEEYIWHLCSPITGSWEKLRVSGQFVAANCIPQRLHAQLDYYIQMREILEHGRDYSPMNGDINPITPEEKSLFGVRVMEPNPCFPKPRKIGRMSLTESDY